MVYRCLTGEVPYKRDSRTATMIAHANAPVPVPSERVADLPAPLDFVVRRAMEKDVEQRAQSAGTLMRWASAQLGERPPPAPVTDESPTEETSLPSPAEVAPATRRRRFSTRLALALVVYAPIWTATYLLGRSL